jgi:hypothetical protein
MRSRQLHGALSAYIEEAGALLQGEVSAGAEVPFEIGSQHARRAGGETPLYCYRALTGQFIAERETALRRLPAHAEAAKALGAFEGLDRYLAAVGGEAGAGKGRTAVRVAMSSLLADVFGEQSEFEVRPERVRAALEKLENAALAGPARLTLLATLHGLAICSPELALATGLTLVQPGALEGLPAHVGAGSGDTDGQGHRVFALVQCEEELDLDAGVSRARELLAELLRALRLFGGGSVALGALGWARVGADAWAAVGIGYAAAQKRGTIVVTAEQEDELRAFCNLVARRAPKADQVAWALRRFELGCERAAAQEALSDHLLALRALLEPEGPQSALLAGRLAALCAKPEQRPALVERVTQALQLERSLIAGERVKQAPLRSLAQELAEHLRALLSDVICGHLEPDLAALADELLLAADAPQTTTDRQEVTDAQQAATDAQEATPDAPQATPDAQEGTPDAPQAAADAQQSEQAQPACDGEDDAQPSEAGEQKEPVGGRS